MSRRPTAAEPVRMDLTPMIDVVFLLIVFFVLVSEMAQAELEQVQLPSADQAVPDRNEQRRRLILNVTGDGAIVVRRQRLSDATLEACIRLEARSLPDPTHPGCSDLPVLIRGDMEAQYRRVQQILQACARHGVWRVELAAARPAGK